MCGRELSVDRSSSDADSAGGGTGLIRATRGRRSSGVEAGRRVTEMTFSFDRDSVLAVELSFGDARVRAPVAVGRVRPDVAE